MSEKKSTLKSLELILNLKGFGLVNFNSTKPNIAQYQKYYQHKNNGKYDDNILFAKENIYKNITSDTKGDKIITYISKKKISAGLVRKTILGDENEVNSSQLSEDTSLRLLFHSQPLIVARGWMTTVEKAKNKDIPDKKPKPKEGEEDKEVAEKGQILKRASGISVIDAEQTCNAEITLETCTREGKKDGTSYYLKEACGEIKYSTTILFDIKKLQFVSIDDNFDRLSMFERDVDEYIKKIDSYGKGNAKKGRFRTSHDNLIGEQGIKLSNEFVYLIIKKTIERILNFRILKATGNALFESLQIKLNNELIDIKTIDDFNNLNLEFGCEFENLD